MIHDGVFRTTHLTQGATMWNRPIKIQIIKKILNPECRVNRRAVEVKTFSDLLRHIWYHLYQQEFTLLHCRFNCLLWHKRKRMEIDELLVFTIEE